jgi:putative aldouronate transport system permease protein
MTKSNKGDKQMPHLTTDFTEARKRFPTAHRRAFRNTLKKMLFNYQLYLFILPTLIYFVVFHYWPMYGVQIAFKDFNAALGIEGSPWVGFKHFIRFMNSPSFWTLIFNTTGISLFQLAVGFPAPILLALLLNEIRSSRFRKVVQTVTYAPHFISIVVLVSMLMILLNPTYGVVNKATGLLGFLPHDFITDKSWFKSLYVLSDIWQNAGWSSIIYLAALAGIDQEHHEASMIDGASRLQRIWHINIPGIMPTIVILFLFAVGGIMSVGFEKVFLMQNPLNLETAEVISTYVYKMGLLQLQYSFSSAVGLFNTTINFILLVFVNALVKRLGETSLW